MSERKYFRVLVALRLHSAAGRKELNGIYRFLAEGHCWDIDLVRSETEVTPDLIRNAAENGFDGLLIGTIEPPALRQIHEANTLPVAFIDYPDPRSLRNISFSVFIHDDTDRIVHAATSHLLKCRGLKHYAFVPTRTPRRWSDDRYQAFARTLERRKEEFSVFSGDGENREALLSWLKTLPKPVGILAAFDDRALDLIECCRALGLGIPQDVTILGIGNDEPLCEGSSPPLSSVAIDFELQGYRAARELQAMMLKPIRPKCREFAIGASGIAVRESTTSSSDHTVIARRAMAFIDGHALEGIGVTDIVRHLHVSRRLADLRFRETTGHTLLEALTDRRISEAKKMLESSDATIADIASHCGYGDGNCFKNAFRRQTGLPPREWRKRHRALPSPKKITWESDA